MRAILPAVFLSLLLVGVSATAADPDPLFRSHDIVELTIRGPIRTIVLQRSDEEDLPAVARWQEPDGQVVESEIGIRARGNFRRQQDNCPFPPIRLDFKKSAVEDTLFHKQDKLKLVTHCRDGRRQYQDVVQHEYLVYRMLNELTDLSYRVRLLQVTYEDTDSNDVREEYGMAIEHKDRFAKRTGLPVVEIPRTSVAALDPEYTNLVSVFQYMIGNTDFSPIAGARDEDCCHNTNLFGDADRRLYAVPYDFDMSGFVDAPYAVVNPKFRLRSVRSRLYRGRCVNNEHLPATINRFIEVKPRLFALIDGHDLLSNASKRKARRYLEDFYRTIEDPGDVERELVNRCVS